MGTGWGSRAQGSLVQDLVLRCCATGCAVDQHASCPTPSLLRQHDVPGKRQRLSHTHTPPLQHRPTSRLWWHQRSSIQLAKRLPHTTPHSLIHPGFGQFRKDLRLSAPPRASSAAMGGRFTFALRDPSQFDKAKFLAALKDAQKIKAPPEVSRGGQVLSLRLRRPLGPPTRDGPTRPPGDGRSGGRRMA